jgi:Ca2+-binding EF-hand superfamily protein
MSAGSPQCASRSIDVIASEMRKLSPRRGTALLVLSAVLIAASAPVQARRSTASVFTAVDTDKDGTVDEAEARQAAAALFDRLDTDKDGTLDTNELRGHLGKEELQANDPDNDGTLTKDEYLAVVEQRFKAADANHDGKLKIDEFASEPGALLVKLITYQVGGVALPPKRD